MAKGYPLSPNYVQVRPIERVQELLGYLHEHRQAMIHLLRQLALVESPSAEPESQGPLLDILSEALVELGYMTCLVSGLARALVRTCYEPAEREEPYLTVRPEFLNAAHLCASRYGLSADLLDVETGRIVRVQEMIEKLLAFARPALEEAGDWEEVSKLSCATLQHGNGATRQREAYGRAGQFEDVVDMLIEETAQGMDQAV